jgi:hypothetical protein
MNFRKTGGVPAKADLAAQEEFVDTFLPVQGLAAELDITLLYLPSYSPHLNLIERLWKITPKQCLNDCYDETFDAFKAGIDACLHDIDPKFQSPIASLMTLRFQTFNNDQVMVG